MPKVKVKKYKGERELRGGLEKMARQGWVVQDRTTRKKMWSMTTGVFTRKQIHTVVFVRAEDAEPDE
jgi:DNA-binding transcriptional regulator PaaX